MRRILNIILVIILTIPTEALALRPMAGRLNPHLSLVRQLEDYKCYDVNPQLKARDSNLLKLGKHLDTATAFQLFRACFNWGAGEEPTITRAKIRSLKRDAASKLLAMLQKQEVEGIYIDPYLSPATFEEFLEGDDSKIYTCVVIEEGKKILTFKPYEMLEQAIDYMDKNNWNPLQEDPAILEYVSLFLEGLDVEKAGIPQRCSNILNEKLLIFDIQPTGIKGVFEKVFKDRPQHRELLARHILSVGGYRTAISSKKQSILVEELLKLDTEVKRKNFLDLLQKEIPGATSAINLIAQTENTSLIRKAAELIAKISEEKSVSCRDFSNMLSKISVQRQKIVMYELNADELRELRWKREVTEGYPPFWQGPTIQLPDCRPRIASFGDTWKFREGRAERYDYKMDLETLINLMGAIIFLRNPEELVNSVQGKKSIFSSLSPDMLAVISELFFMEHIDYVHGGGDAKSTFKFASDMLLMPYIDDKFAGFHFGKDMPEPLEEGSIKAENFKVFSNPEEFFKAHNIEIQGGITSGGNHLYARLKDGSNKRAVIKVVPYTTDRHGTPHDYNASRLMELNRESRLLAWISRNKDRIGLECDYPVPVEMVASAEPFLFRLEDLGNFSLEFGQQLFLWPNSKNHFCFCYITNEDYFTYLDDHRQEYRPEEYLRRAVRDLARFARCGIFLEKWASYSHNVDSGAVADYDWSYERGAGTMPKWLYCQWYTNYRRQSPADLGHTVTLENLKDTYSVEGGRRKLGDIPFSAAIIEAANLWKHFDYPFKFFYPEDRDACKDFLRGVYKDFYRIYSGASADILDSLIDWDNVSDRFMYEVGSVIRQENFPHFDLGYGHGVFPYPELIRATFITVTLAMMEKSIRDRAEKEGKTLRLSDVTAPVKRVDIAIQQAA